jgi:hypothetical protein
MDASGGFVVVWESCCQDGDSRGIFGRRFAENGVARGNDFQVNTTTQGRQDLASVATNVDGSFVVVWRGYVSETGYEVFGRRYDSSGAPLGDEFQLTNDFNGESPPAVATSQDAGFVVAWETEFQSGSGYDVAARRYDSDGAPLSDGFQVNETTEYDQTYPAVAMDASGGFVVVWQTYDEGTAVVGRRFDGAGTAKGGEFVVADSGYPKYPAVSSDPDGRFVVVWEGSDGSDGGVLTRRFASAGGALGEGSPVNTFVFGTQTEPAVAMHDDGGFVVVWQSEDQDGDYIGVFGQALDGGGHPLGGEFQVNTETYDRQDVPAVAASGGGEFVVVWSSYLQDGPEGGGVFGQRFAPEPQSWMLGLVAFATLGRLAAHARRVR